MSKRYNAVITTVYTIYANDSDKAVESMREVLLGGIFQDNVLIKSQACRLLDLEDPANKNFDIWDPNATIVAASWFKTGREQEQ